MVFCSNKQRKNKTPAYDEKVETPDCRSYFKIPNRHIEDWKKLEQENIRAQREEGKNFELDSH